jgi:hypothetical protein
MTIQESDFILTPSVNDASNFWDLQLLVTIKGVKGKEDRQEFKQMGYGLTLSSAIRRIANYRVMHNNPKEALTMHSYLDKLKEQEDLLIKLVKV